MSGQYYCGGCSGYVEYSLSLIMAGGVCKSVPRPVLLRECCVSVGLGLSKASGGVSMVATAYDLYQRTSEVGECSLFSYVCLIIPVVMFQDKHGIE